MAARPRGKYETFRQYRKNLKQEERLLRLRLAGTYRYMHQYGTKCEPAVIGKNYSNHGA